MSKKATQPAGLFMSRLPTVSSVTGFKPVAIAFPACPSAATPSDSMSGRLASRLKTTAPLSPGEIGQVTRTRSPVSTTLTAGSAAPAGTTPTRMIATMGRGIAARRSNGLSVFMGVGVWLGQSVVPRSAAEPRCYRVNDRGASQQAGRSRGQ